MTSFYPIPENEAEILRKLLNPADLPSPEPVLSPVVVEIDERESNPGVVV